MNGLHHMSAMDGFDLAEREAVVEPAPTGGKRDMNGVHDMSRMDGIDPAEREVVVEPAPTEGSGA